MSSDTTVWTPRMTVSAVVERNGQYLVVEERDDHTGKTVFNQPAGHLDPHESLETAAIREVREETGYQFTPQGFTGLYRWEPSHVDLTFMRLNFVGTVGEETLSDQLDSDIIATHWLTRGEIENLPVRSPLVLRCIDDYLSGALHPLSALIETA